MPTDSLRDAAFCDVLNRELVCALGCTEPIAVAYAAALASQTLGCEPDHMDVACSGNIIKNVKSVTVPNSGGMHGIEAAACWVPWVATLRALSRCSRALTMKTALAWPSSSPTRLLRCVACRGCAQPLHQGDCDGRGPYRGRRDYRPPHQRHVPYARRYSGVRQVGGGVRRLRRTRRGRACGRQRRHAHVD